MRPCFRDGPERRIIVAVRWVPAELGQTELPEPLPWAV
jgi:hypothetical protein